MTTITQADSARTVPFFDGAPMMDGLKAEILDDLSGLIDSGRFINGPEVAEFEASFAAYCETAACIGAASGLDALRLALIAAGLEPGDEVLVPAMTFIATFEAVTQAGGTPVPVDVSPSDSCMDPAALEAAVGPRTRAMMPVHLYGRIADMAAITVIAARHGLWLV